MCLACMEYLKGNLTDSEFKKNLREFSTVEHDPRALQKAEIALAKDKKQEKPKTNRKTR